LNIASIRRKRLPRELRERLIVEEAVRFFSEVGFEGQTRTLAERLGVTQPLLYRYFTDKEALIERVFEEVYLKGWNADWDKLLKDRNQPLFSRLSAFYRSYRRIMFEPQLVRLFMLAGLKGDRMSERYLARLHLKLITPLCIEFRHEWGLPPVNQTPIDDREIDIAWAIHGAIFQIAIRKWVCNQDLENDFDAIIDETLRAFLLGCRTTVSAIHAALPAPA